MRDYIPLQLQPSIRYTECSVPPSIACLPARTVASILDRKTSMAKPTSVAAVAAATPTSDAARSLPKKRGWEEIEALFAAQKERKQELIMAENDADAERQRRRRKHQPKQKHAQDGSLRITKTSHKDSGRVTTATGKDWVDDGLGGRFNSEGFTGRVEDGVKIFKAHVLYKSDSGRTKDCPFDCDCCFI